MRYINPRFTYFTYLPKTTRRMVPRTCRLKCRAALPAVLTATQLYLAASDWRARDSSSCRPVSLTLSLPASFSPSIASFWLSTWSSFSHVMFGNGLPRTGQCNVTDLPRMTLTFRSRPVSSTDAGTTTDN